MKRLFIIVTAVVSVAFVAMPAWAANWSRYYASAPVQGTTEFTVVAGQSADVDLRFVNRGLYRWRGGLVGWRHVSLYATAPYARKSVFRDATWMSAIQPAPLWEARVEPGGTGSFHFTLHAPPTPGTYVERFQVAVEDTTWVDGSAVTLTIKVVAPGSDEAGTVGVSTSAKAYVVMDAETGELVATKNPDEVRSIASMTKLMTVMVAREAGEDPDQVVALTRDDEVGGGRLRVAYGTQVSVNDLVASAIIGSANNAAQALARVSGLSQDQFVARMDAKAAAIGLSRTSFADPTGIEVPNVSTAREMAALARTAFADPWIARFAGVPEYTVATSAGPHLIKNTNKLLADGSIEVVAGKTGYINEAGYTLVTRLRRAGKHDLIVVVLGCDTSGQSFNDAKMLAENVWTSKTLALGK